VDVQQFTYSLPHVTIMLPLSAKTGRPKFVVDGKEMVVEAAAKEYLRTLGWWVISGQEASLFLAAMSSNFRNSFFASVLTNYIGTETPMLVERLDRLFEQSTKERFISAEHLSTAVDLLCRYYSSERDHRRFRRLAAAIGKLSPVDQIGLLKVYRYIGYFTKGIPDLFAIKSGEFIFTEVKSENDALRPEQYFFAETLLRELGTGFQVIRVLDAFRDHKSALANPADVHRTTKISNKLV
jgi:hypothetical protein